MLVWKTSTLVAIVASSLDIHILLAYGCPCDELIDSGRYVLDGIDSYFMYIYVHECV